MEEDKQATLYPEKRLKLRKKAKAVLERKRISKATLCPEKRLKLRKKAKAVQEDEKLLTHQMAVHSK
ncbi:hypothetical protein [Acinetobacter seifertii]|uniref:hypothetical protein n=1 Tax=Acinetobacter seifertii TaxID=1530123 RepID=UPI0040411C40